MRLSRVLGTVFLSWGFLATSAFGVIRHAAKPQAPGTTARPDSPQTCEKAPKETKEKLDALVKAFADLKQDPFNHDHKVRRPGPDGRLKDTFPYHEVPDKRVDLISQIGLLSLEEPACGRVILAQLRDALKKERGDRTAPPDAFDGHALIEVALDDLETVLDGKQHGIPVISRQKVIPGIPISLPKSLLFPIPPEPKTPPGEAAAKPQLQSTQLTPALENRYQSDPKKFIYYLPQDFRLEDAQETKTDKGFITSFRLTPQSIAKVARVQSAKIQTDSPAEATGAPNPYGGGYPLGQYGYQFPMGQGYGGFAPSLTSKSMAPYQLDAKFRTPSLTAALKGEWRDIEVYDPKIMVKGELSDEVYAPLAGSSTEKGYLFKIFSKNSLLKEPLQLKYRTHEIGMEGVAGPQSTPLPFTLSGERPWATTYNINY